jgi:hypothetical protein
MSDDTPLLLAAAIIAKAAAQPGVSKALKKAVNTVGKRAQEFTALEKSALKGDLSFTKFLRIQFAREALVHAASAAEDALDDDPNEEVQAALRKICAMLAVISCSPDKGAGDSDKDPGGAGGAGGSAKGAAGAAGSAGAAGGAAKRAKY